MLRINHIQKLHKLVIFKYTALPPTGASWGLTGRPVTGSSQLPPPGSQPVGRSLANRGRLCQNFTYYFVSISTTKFHTLIFNMSNVPIYSFTNIVTNKMAFHHYLIIKSTFHNYNNTSLFIIISFI